MPDVAVGGSGFNRLGLVRGYRTHGWRELHPIIPPWVMPELGGKCPGVMWGDGTWHRVGVQREGFYAELEDAGQALSHEARRAWGAGGAGIGVNARRFPAIDVDVLDEAVAEALRGFLRERFGEGCFLRVGRWPKFLMPFRLAEGLAGVRKKVWKLGREGEEGGQIELLGWGQQYVLEGVHGGTGEPYRWLAPEKGVEGTGRPVVSRMPVLGLEALGELLGALLKVAGARRRGGGGGGGSAVRIEERTEAPPRPVEELWGPEDVCWEVMRRWPNGPSCGVSYDVYVAVAHALWGASGSGALWDGFALFERWARQHPKANVGNDEAKWRSIRGARVGVEWLIGAVPGADEDARARRRRPGRGEPIGEGAGVITAGVRARWLLSLADWRVRQRAAETGETAVAAAPGAV